MDSRLRQQAAEFGHHLGRYRGGWVAVLDAAISRDVPAALRGGH